MRLHLAILALAFGAATLAPALAEAAAATPFTLRDTTTASVSLSDLQGKVVVLSFWATWCGPCKTEMPHLQKLQNDLGEKGLKVLSIDTDDARTVSQVKPYITKSGYTFTVLLDTSSTVVKAYNPSMTLPYTVIIGRDGQIAKVHSGYNPGDEVTLREEIAAELAKPAPGTAPSITPASTQP